ncbi:MAG: leucyl/phenylalanyl-tRNA--protein transferase [Proteobacteria bacterium]|nr:leucyl/phenylalanyl-tRNA--protein transferase [Pseudomonadota bacterium]
MPEPVSLIDILNAYCCGMFPMADGADAEEFYWYDPPVRALMPIDGLHVSRRLRKTVLAGPYDVRIDTDFTGIIDGCAAATERRPNTWINRSIRDLFIALHEKGFAHSVECWKDGALAGGVYGLAIGAFFAGESMFSAQRDASKVALVHLCARLQKGGFRLFDAQIVNDHIKKFGAYEVKREEYLTLLGRSLPLQADFMLSGADEKDIVRAYLA